MSDNISEIMPAKDGVTLYVGIGNSLRGDDIAGMMIAEGIETTDRVKTLAAGEKPEEAYDEALALKPAKVVFLDAADMGLPAGSMELLYEDTISVKAMTTHKMPLPLISRLIREETGADVVICGIQPENVDFGAGMSVSVKETCELIIKTINNA